MLTETELKILGIIGKNLVVTLDELKRNLSENEHDGIINAIQKLQSMGYISTIESLANTFVITQRGARRLRET